MSLDCFGERRSGGEELGSLFGLSDMVILVLVGRE